LKWFFRRRREFVEAGEESAGEKYQIRPLYSRFVAMYLPQVDESAKASDRRPYNVEFFPLFFASISIRDGSRVTDVAKVFDMIGVWTLPIVSTMVKATLLLPRL
jgi:hypothetical protein